MRRVEQILVVAGLALVGWYAAASLRTALYQQRAQSVLNQSIPPAAASRADAPAAAPPLVREPSTPPRAFETGDLIGQLEIPRIQLSVAIASGDDDGTLKLAAGHLPDTPMPWEPGNSAIAGHRDTLFRPLRYIKVNDLINVNTPEGRFAYRVTSLRVVDPSDLSVLDPTVQPSLTLVTCYPFSFIGNAPKRFIVRAARCNNCGGSPGE